MQGSSELVLLKNDCNLLDLAFVAFCDNSHIAFCNSKTYRFPRVFGDEFGDKFGDKLSDSLNLVSNVVTNLVMNLVNHHIL